MNTSAEGDTAEAKKTASHLRLPAMRLLPLAAPAALYTVLAVAVVGSIVSWLRLDPSPLVAHLSIVLSILALQYAVSALLIQLPARQRVRRALIWVINLPIAAGLLVYYCVLGFCLSFMGDIPTRRFIASYVKEVPALLVSIPLTTTTLVTVCAAVALVLISFGALVAWCLAESAADVNALLSSRARRVAARVAGYGAFAYLWLAFTVSFQWHIDTREPLTAGWTGLRIVGANEYGARNPVEVARDREVAQQYRALTAARRPNIVLVYVDALRADATEPYGATRKNMPFVTSLVRSGELKQVDFGLAACSATICGLGAILQSRPTRRQSAANFSLPKLLAQQSYRNVYILASNHQGYFDLKNYYEPFDLYVDGSDIDPERSSDDYAVLDGIARLGRWDGRPTFLMLGLVSPHVIAIKHEEHRRYRPDHITLDRERFAEAYRNAYDNGVGQADDVIAKAWRSLADAGYLNKDTIVVITSDHGESLGERGIFGHLRSLFATELRIPIWIRTPGFELRNTRLARQVDIAPTLVAALGLPVPGSWAGTPLSQPDPAEWSEHYLPDKPQLVAFVRYGSGSAIKYLLDQESQAEAVFDVFQDPAETRNLLDAIPPDVLEQVRSRAHAFMRDR